MKEKVIIFLFTVILFASCNNVYIKKDLDKTHEVIPSKTTFRLKQIPEFYKNNPHKIFMKYGLIYPAALIFKETKDSYYFSLSLEILPQYIKLSKKTIFNLLIRSIPKLHFQDKMFKDPLISMTKSIKHHITYNNLSILYKYVALRIDEQHEQDFLLFEHMMLFLDLILDGYNVYISHTVWNFYNDIEKKSSYAYFKCTLDTISIYKLFSPYPVHGKKAPLLRALDMLNEEWEKSFFENYKADFHEK